MTQVIFIHPDGRREHHTAAAVGKWIEKITMAEYDQAPRVVQMQVSRAEVNQGMDAIEAYLTSTGSSHLGFSEQKGYELLEQALHCNSEENNPDRITSWLHQTNRYGWDLRSTC